MDLGSIINTATGATATGAAGMDEVAALQKALTAGYGTDVAQLSGGGALRIQSLDKTMQSTIQENEHFKLFNRLAKTKATATVDEWTEQSGVGGFPGGSTNAETGIIADASGVYNRRVGLVKFLMTRRQVSFVSTLQNNIADIEAVEYQNGALQLCTDAEILCFDGDSSVVPTEFDGIYAQMLAGVNQGQVDGGNIIDAQASPLANMTLVNQAAAVIAGNGNFGRPTDLFMSLDTQVDFDNELNPAFRVALDGVANGGVMLGAPVTGVRTSQGNIKTNNDVFINDQQNLVPFEVRFPAVAASQVGLKPTAVTAVTATNAASQFGAAQAGNYFYYVAGVNSAGTSTGLVSTQVAVAAGQAATLTIQPSAGRTETGYLICRTRLNGGNVVVGGADGISDFRVMCRIPATGAAVTYTDLNRDIPGTVKAYILNMTPSMTAISWRQLLPMIKFALYPTNAAVVPWAQLLFGYLRMTKRRQHVVVKNILPNSSQFRPFNV